MELTLLAEIPLLLAKTSFAKKRKTALVTFNLLAVDFHFFKCFAVAAFFMTLQTAF